MRTFLLIDKDGNTYDMTSKDTAFFYGIKGLGYEEETNFQRIKERFSLLKRDLKQGTITGTVRFWQDNAEAKYFTFAQFCQNSPHRLVYNPKPGESQSYYRNGYITKIERSDGENSLTVNIEFTAETPWYKQLSEFNYGGESEGGKTYDYEYSYTYGGNLSNTIILESDSRLPSPIKLIIFGEVVNPVWRHYIDGELVATGKLNGTVSAGNRLVIDTTTIPYSIKQFDSEGVLVSDMYQQSDFSTERFIRLGYGSNTITVQADDAEIISVGVEAQIEYATV